MNWFSYFIDTVFPAPREAEGNKHRDLVRKVLINSMAIDRGLDTSEAWADDLRLMIGAYVSPEEHARRLREERTY